ncbi:serine/threonine-protein kinase STY13-like [Macadamia integrifolia]|uniref:serine/threonine-protein kinase STY13-like n=1 Tax=Macadamia integrifolia TaxID=60698 RepID=UPI001C4E480A|nr:serine/threonine-protein kinase STY13-like [Macadamia integrifolia]
MAMEPFDTFYQERKQLVIKQRDFNPYSIELDESKLISTDQLLIEGKTEIGSGGYSTVFKGWYKDEVVAIKYIENDDRRKRENQNVIKKEIDILSQMKNDNIVKFIGASVHPAACIIVMEYVDGKSLEDFIKEEVFDLTKSLRFALDISRAMEHVHEKKIIHMDLKPENILISTDLSTLKLVDFGIAVGETAERTQTLPKAGSYLYTAPELLRRMKYDHKVDIYSFSLIFWGMLKNELPFEDMNLHDIKTKVVEQGTRPCLEGIPSEISSLLQRCWSDEINLRPDFTDVVKELSEFIGSS